MVLATGTRLFISETVGRLGPGITHRTVALSVFADIWRPVVARR